MDAIAPESDVLQDLYAYWLRQSPPAGLPGRSDIDPVDIGSALPHVMLIDVLENRREFVYRLVGTHIVQAAGFDFTGWTVADFFASIADDGRVEEYVQAVADGRPRYGCYRMLDPDRSHFFYERLIMPLAADGQRVDMLFCGFHFRPVDPLTT